MHAPSTPLPGRLRRLTMVTGLGSLALALAAAGPAAANPFGVTRQGGDEIAAIRSLTPEQARALVAKRTDATARIDTGKASLAFARGGISFRGALMLSSLESLDAETAAVLAGFEGKGLTMTAGPLSGRAVRALAGFPGGEPVSHRAAALERVRAGARGLQGRQPRAGGARGAPG